jgi:hypothetical protein
LIFHDPASTRARRADEVGITPAKPGSAQASLARRARNVRKFSLLDFSRHCANSEVKNPNCMFYYGIAKRQAFRFFYSCRYITVPLPNADDFSQSRFDTRPACRLRRRNPGEAGVWRAKLAAGRGTWKIFTS